MGRWLFTLLNLNFLMQAMQVWYVVF